MRPVFNRLTDAMLPSSARSFHAALRHVWLQYFAVLLRATSGSSQYWQWVLVESSIVVSDGLRFLPAAFAADYAGIQRIAHRAYVIHR